MAFSRHAIRLCSVLFMLLPLTSCSTFKSSEVDKEELRADVREMARITLYRLYQLNPAAKKAVADASGYAVFSNFGMKILFFGGGNGEGIAISKRVNNETFMKMIEVQAGLGMGIKKFSQVWVFENLNAYYQFIHSGWEFGGQATAAAQAKDKGGDLSGALSVSPGVWLYQMTETGLALEFTAKGSKYYKNDTLN